MRASRWQPLVWLTLVAFMVSSCSTAINVRSEDYARIDTESAYRIVMIDGKEYEAHHLVIADGVASFRHKSDQGEKVSVPIDQIQLIQKINDNELVTGLVGIGIATALLVGLVLVMTQD